tara:strand:+ start:2617 stop:2955 length:339 start_codon:yes stop_codon:yes gene_type:complete
MAITYKWYIDQMSAHVESEGQNNVIYTVQWNYTGSEEVNGKTYQSIHIGSENYTYVAGTTFIPYENTEAFEAVVIGWLEGSLDVPAMQANIEAAIKLEIEPVDESLYFTWQN